ASKYAAKNTPTENFSREINDVSRTKRFGPLVPLALIIGGLGEVAYRSRWFRDAGEIRRTYPYQNLQFKELRESPRRRKGSKKRVF
ncbi:unnamed protein product, partial [Allacma fusca]